MKQAARALPFFLFAGVAVQAFGFYLFMILIPFVLYWRVPLSQTMKLLLRTLAVCLFLLWVIFPLGNFYNLWQGPHTHIPWDQLLKSHFSSSFAICALLLYIFTWKDKFQGVGVTPSSDSFVKEDGFVPFLQGFFIASILETLWIMSQQKFGLDFSLHSYGEAKRMSTGLFRTPGFYSHPLTFAGVSLAYIGWLGSLILTGKTIVWNRSKLFLLILLHSYFAFASGGRFVTLIVLLGAPLFLLIYYYQARKSEAKPFAFSLFAVAACLTGFLLWQLGVGERFFSLVSGTHPEELDRLIFWRVHWQMFLDKPFFGQGFAQLNAFAREQYYNHLGYASLTNKYPAHNFILEVLSNVGLFGFSVILGALTVGGRALHKLCQLSEQETYFKTFLVALGLNFINGLTQNVFFDASVMYIYHSLLFLMIWNAMGFHGRTRNAA